MTATASGEAVGQQKTVSEYVDEFGPRLDAIGQSIGGVQRQRVAAEDLSTKRLLASIGRRSDPQTLFFWVRDNIAFEPYEGALRGPRGTLMTRAGNSLDQALLLQELLKHTRVKSRIAWGKLEPKVAHTLLTDFAGEADVAGLEVPDGMDRYNPARDRALFNAVREHYWVEAFIGKKWTPIDPSFRRSAWGVTPAEKEGDAPSIPEHALVKATVELFVQGADGKTRSLVKVEGPLDELAFRNLTLSFPASDRKGTTLTPRLAISGKATRGEGFKPSDAKRVWLEFFFDRGGRSQHKVRRDLFVAGSALNVFEADQQVFSVLIVPGWLNPEFFTAVAQQELTSLYSGGEAMRKLVEQGVVKTVREADVLKRVNTYVEELLSKAGGMMALTYAMVADRTSLRMAQKMGVRAFYEDPRVIIVGGFREADRFYWQIDLRNDEIRAVPAKGLPPVVEHAFQALRGRFNSQFEAAVVSRLTGKPVLSVDQILVDAIEQRSPIVTLYPASVEAAVAELKISNEAKARLKHQVRKEGKAAILPAKATKVGAGTVTVWWALDPTSGAIVGTREDGSNGGFGAQMLTGKAPEGKARAGNLEVFVFDEALTLLHNLAGTVWVMLRGEPNVCSVSCSTVKDLVKLPTLMCVEGATGGKKLPLDSEMAQCLEPRPLATDDIMGLSMGCEDIVRPSRCGAVMAVGNIVGRYEPKYSTEPVGPLTGPWKPKALKPFDLAGCKCGK